MPGSRERVERPFVLGRALGQGDGYELSRLRMDAIAESICPVSRAFSGSCRFSRCSVLTFGNERSKAIVSLGAKSRRVRI